jgi:hypothetical protein
MHYSGYSQTKQPWNMAISQKTRLVYEFEKQVKMLIRPERPKPGDALAAISLSGGMAALVPQST